jgi:PAS domain S-box-containing protein
VAYALNGDRSAKPLKTSGRTVGGAIGLVALLVMGMALLATTGEHVLPQIMQGNQYSSSFNIGRHGQWIVTAAVAFLLWQRRPHSVLDLWVLVTLLAWCIEIALVAILNAGRYDVGFYAGRAYGLFASLFVLVVLLTEQSGVYAGLVQAQERKAAESALKESEARFRLMADGMPQLAWMARPDGWIYWYNKRWYEYTGTTPADMEGWGWQRVHDPQMLPMVLERWKHSVATGEPFEMVFPLRGGDGRYRRFLTRVSPLKDPDGSVLHWFGTNTDVSAQHEAEEALRAADRRKDEFLATLAHELRNPLAPIRNAVAIMERSGRLSEDLEAMRRIVDRQVHHLTRLVDDLMEVSRINEGKIHLRRTRIALQWAIADAVEAVRPSVQAAGHELSVSVPPGAIYVDADPTRVAQVVINLLANAVKFTPTGGRISLTIERERTDAVIRVRDTGTGIDESHLTKVFEMFSQPGAPLERTQGGLGIGLALVRGLVELHGGSVTAHSAGIGCGSEFIVRLPAVDAGTEERAASPAIPFPRPKRILVVDDNRDAAFTLRQLLESAGHEVREAYDGAEGVCIAKEFRPDVVLLDIGMPRMNGYDAAKEIRKMADGAAPRVIAITGWGQDADKARARESGFDNHLTKPVDPAMLTRML